MLTKTIEDRQKNITGGSAIRHDVERLLQFAAALESLGVRKAVAENGDRYMHDSKKGVTVAATRDVVVKRTRSTLGVMVSLPGASKDEVLNDLGSLNQEIRGAAVGHSQSWVSRRKQVPY